MNRDAEILRLRTALRDIVALSIIPAAWVGREPPDIAARLADVLVGSLYLDFAFVRLCDPNGGGTVEVTRGDTWEAFPEWLERRLAAGGHFSRKEIIQNVGSGPESCRGIVIPVGVNAEGGVVAAACDRADFPTEIDQLLLSTAANHAATAFQNSRLIHERRRAENALRESEQELRQARDELELKVAERTAELRRSEAYLRKTEVELAHATRVMTLGELVASIAHEVNQPLGAIVTNGHACLRLLSREEPDLDKSREVIERMISEGMRASQVIKRIRELMHKSPAEKASLNINETIEEVVALVSSDMLGNKIELKVELQSDLPPLLGDRIQLQQVVLNLILNSKEALSGAQSKPREIIIGSRKGKSNEVIVAVRDTGRGLDANDVERIFDPFFTTKSEGMGLGLSISRTIIEAHGGTLWATPNQGKGATVEFMLPPSVIRD